MSSPNNTPPAPAPQRCDSIGEPTASLLLYAATPIPATAAAARAHIQGEADADRLMRRLALDIARPGELAALADVADDPYYAGLLSRIQKALGALQKGVGV